MLLHDGKLGTARLQDFLGKLPLLPGHVWRFLQQPALPLDVLADRGDPAVCSRKLQQLRFFLHRP